MLNTAASRGLTRESSRIPLPITYRVPPGLRDAATFRAALLIYSDPSVWMKDFMIAAS